MNVQFDDRLNIHMLRFVRKVICVWVRGACNSEIHMFFTLNEFQKKLFELTLFDTIFGFVWTSWAMCNMMLMTWNWKTEVSVSCLLPNRSGHMCWLALSVSVCAIYIYMIDNTILLYETTTYIYVNNYNIFTDFSIFIVYIVSSEEKKYNRIGRKTIRLIFKIFAATMCEQMLAVSSKCGYNTCTSTLDFRNTHNR